MLLQPSLLTIAPKTLMGMRLTMSLANNRTGELWGRFMPNRKVITHPLSDNLFSVALYGSTYFSDFSPVHTFERWAAVEVAEDSPIPEGMERLNLPGGLYAVFHYKGPAADPSIFQYIYGTWLHESNFEVDDRPHFEVLGEKYSNHAPDSEEDIWIPIRPK